MGGACGICSKRRDLDKVSENPDGLRPLGRARHKWEDDIKINHETE
jgi:hypothetical protein